MKIYGIDVSHHQGAIDWAKTASELCRVNSGTSPGFAILRAGYSNRNGKGGLWEDSRFTANVAGCEKNGVPMGVYFYCYDQSPEAARITAKHVVNLLKGHKWDYPIYYDVEYEPYNKTCGKAQISGGVGSEQQTLVLRALVKIELRAAQGRDVDYGRRAAGAFFALCENGQARAEQQYRRKNDAEDSPDVFAHSGPPLYFIFIGDF